MKDTSKMLPQHTATYSPKILASNSTHKSSGTRATYEQYEQSHSNSTWTDFKSRPTDFIIQPYLMYVLLCKHTVHKSEPFWQIKY